jgi:hypothetical protein
MKTAEDAEDTEYSLTSFYSASQVALRVLSAVLIFLLVFVALDGELNQAIDQI